MRLVVFLIGKYYLRYYFYKKKINKNCVIKKFEIELSGFLKVFY